MDPTYLQTWDVAQIASLSISVKGKYLIINRCGGTGNKEYLHVADPGLVIISRPGDCTGGNI